MADYEIEKVITLERKGRKKQLLVMWEAHRRNLTVA